ncbi:MAG: glycosyltransferase [Acidobacteriaceae bacterium]|nr:glycosyltransferase [Acidobacteriaceae bacterium]
MRTREAGCDISLVTFLRSGASSGPATNEFIDAVRSAGLPIDIIRERFPFDPGVSNQLRTVFNEQAPDIVQTHAVKSHFLIRLTRSRNARWIAYHHGYTDPDLKMRVYNRLDRVSLPAADRVVTVCTSFVDELVRKSVKRERTRVLPNAIDLPDCCRGSTGGLRHELNLRENARIILAVGRLSKEKGHSYLVSAAQLLKRGYPDLDFQVLLIGDGRERRRLEQQAQDLAVTDCIRFLGHQNDPLRFYSVADVFVLPSLTEGSPNVLLEAMAAKTPVVATAVGGVPETVENERSALLVAPEDPSALAQTTGRLLADAALATKLRENAYADVIAHHSPEVYCSSLLRIYTDLLNS